MTVINKLENALASAKSLEAQFKTFSLDTNDQQAKQTFNQLSNQMKNVAQEVQSRVDFANNQEPQYAQESMADQNQMQSINQNKNR
jgi:CHASE3 domain sensor protein